MDETNLQNQPNTDPVTTPEVPSTPEPTPPQDAQPHKKKLVLVIALLAVLLAGGAVAWAPTHKNSAKPTSAASTNTAAKSKTAAQPAPYFYLTSSPNSVSTYNLTTGAKSSIDLGGDKTTTFTGGSSSQNKVLQVSADGKVIAYATGQAVNCGEGGCGLNDAGIRVKAGGKTEKLVSITSSQDMDWFLNPDGKAIYYLVWQTNTTPVKYDLHKVTIADKKDTLLKSGITPKPSYSRATAMLPIGNDSFRFYDSGPGAPGLVEYSYHDGQLTSKDIAVNSFCPNYCDVSYPAPLSPDGTMLALRGNTGSALSYFILNLENGSHQQNATGLKTTEQANQFYWSPDGKSLAYAVSGYGGEGQNKVGLEFRFEIFDASTGKTTTGFSDASLGIKDPNNDNHRVTLFGWSNDGKYIAFRNNGTIKLYTVADGTSKDSGVAADRLGDSDTSSGWYSQ